MYFEIDPITFEVRIFNEGESEPFYLIHCHTSNDPFSSIEDATIVAQDRIKALTTF